MRFEGTLSSWYAERGHGTVTPAQGGEALFVHVSAFPLDGQAPVEGERLSFELVSRSDGSKQAVRLQRLSPATLPAALRAPRTSSRPRPIGRRRRHGPFVVLASLILLLGLGLLLWPAGPQERLAQRSTALSSSGSSVVTP